MKSRIVCTIAAAGLLLTGCGSLMAGSGQPGSNAAASAHAINSSAAARLPRKTAPAQVFLCRRVMVPLSVRIVRIGGPLVAPGSSVGQGTGGIGEPVTVTDTIARSPAEAACALPVLPPGIRNCPPAAVPYQQYQLTFTIPGRVLAVVTVHAGGCPQVSGVGPVRWLLTRQPFLAELGRIAALSRPGNPVKVPLNGKPIGRLSS